MVFQLTQIGELTKIDGGWGGRCRHIVDTAVSWVRTDGLAWSVENVQAVLPVDVAISADGARIAVASAAATTVPLGLPTFQRFETLSAPSVGTRTSGSCGWIGGPPPPLAFDEAPTPAGRVVALAYDNEARLIVQTREPSALVRGGQSVALPGASRKHTGHELFHFATKEALACASCHPEGQDDGHVWTFPGQGERRTQNVSGGILGTEPFHWNGDLANFEMLVHETFNRRMEGPLLHPVYVNALASWIDKIPRPAGIAPSDPAAAERGHAIFVDSAVGCATCHAGAKLTNNGTFDVRTGGAFQVPSLLGLALRAPYLHTGCAATLAERLGPCGGGDAHGHMSGLTAQNLADLVAYLETL
jgi:cytochrome c